MPAALSVVLVNKLGFDRLRRVIACLEAQSLAGQLELVIVSPFEPPSQAPSSFACVKYVACDSMDSLGPPRALGVRACSAPYVVFAEDHCFPQPQWAESILGRLREGWTGVGPAILNHNPGTWTSRADWLLNYGGFGPDRQSGSCAYIAPHNSAYATAALQRLDGELGELLQMDRNLQSRLLSEGGRLFFEPSARTAHTNLSRPRCHWSTQFHGARVYGALRARYEHWTAIRCGAYTLVFPAIAALRLVRACTHLKGPREVPLFPLLILASTIAAIGESCGYLFGAGSSLGWRAEEELDRVSGLIEAERRLLLP